MAQTQHHNQPGFNDFSDEYSPHGESFNGHAGLLPPPPARPYIPSAAPLSGGGGGGAAFADDYSNEPPLLEELGINFSAIGKKTTAVLMLHKPINSELLLDGDLAGPLVFCVVLGLCLLLVRLLVVVDAGSLGAIQPRPQRRLYIFSHVSLPSPPLKQSGKLHFGYIYGFGLLGCVCMMLLVNLMQGVVADTVQSETMTQAPFALDLSALCLTISMLGYCLLPIVLLAALAVFVNLHGWVGVVLGLAAILWSTLSCARFFEVALRMSDRKWLIAYPAGLFYACFALMVRGEVVLLSLHTHFFFVFLQALTPITPPPPIIAQAIF